MRSEGPSDLSPEQLTANQAHLQQGTGWRLGRRPHTPPYTTLIGGDHWALELTEAEWQDLGQGWMKLQVDLQDAQAHLMAEEAITVEHQTPRLTLIASGFPQHYQLYVQLHTGRRGEGYWPAEVVPEVGAAIQRLMQMES